MCVFTHLRVLVGRDRDGDVALKHHSQRRHACKQFWADVHGVAVEDGALCVFYICVCVSVYKCVPNSPVA